MNPATNIHQKSSTSRPSPDPKVHDDVAYIDASFRVGGRYELSGVLGHGGQATVYRAWDRELEHPVALKVLSSSVVDDEDARAMIESEARILQEVRHRGIVRLFDVLVEKDNRCLVLELIDGPTMAERLLREGQLPAVEVAAVGAEIATVLGYLHSRRLVHGDIKPANIATNGHGVVKLMDFGLTRDAGTGEKDDGARVNGTPAYMAPECLVGHTPLLASDVYALGIVLFECMTARLPFADTSNLYQAHLEHDPLRLSDLVATVPDELSDLVGSCLEKQPVDRPTATHVEERLRAIAARLSRKRIRGHTPPLGVRRPLLPQLTRRVSSVVGLKTETTDR